jgi:hypothetical protein
MADVQTFELDWKLYPVNTERLNFVLIDLQSKSNFYWDYLCGEEYERRRQLNVKIHILFCGDNSWTVALKQKKFDT